MVLAAKEILNTRQTTITRVLENSTTFTKLKKLFMAEPAQNYVNQTLNQPRFAEVNAWEWKILMMRHEVIANKIII